MAACPSCRSHVEPDDRFCANCGVPLAGDLGVSARRTEHRLVTALYVDLVGSTGLAEALDPENLAAVVGSVQNAVRSEVTDRGGSIGAFVGDGVLGVFGLPTAHEDDPVRALHAAQAILDRVAAVDDAFGDRFDVSIEVRVGVNTGELLAPVGDEPDLGTLAGDVLNVAARLQELASPGAIVVSERTARSASSFRFDDLGLLDVRGRARPVHTFRVLGHSEVEVQRVRAPLHGREQEVELLRELFHRVVAEGSPHRITVTGGAGVGKSRLVREFLDWAASVDPALTTVGGRCLPYGEDITYRPLADVLADLTGISASSDPVTITDAVGALVANHVVDEDAATVTAALMRMIGITPQGETTPPSPRRVRELLRTAWRSLISGLAADGPVILLVEDIHWAGDALLDLLDHIVERGEGPLLIVAPARLELLERSSRWNESSKRASTLRIEPLADEEANRLAARLLAEHGLAVADAGRVTERAGGNPFFIEELVRELGLRRDDTGHDVEHELPATIQGVLSARIDLLALQERHVLQAASVIGRIFWPSALSSITREAPDRIAAILNRLEALQLIRVKLRSTRSDEVEYIFQHVLIREAAYARLSRPDLARMHAAVADWLESVGDAGADEAERLAFHTWRAHDAAAASSDLPESEIGRLRALAVVRLVAAASKARERAAFSRSRELADLAESMADDPLERAIALEELGRTALAEYNGDAAWAQLRSAVDSYLEVPSPDPEAVAMAAAAAVETPLRWKGTIRQLPPMSEVLRYLDIGIEHAGSGDSEALALLMAGLAFAPTTPGPEGTVAREVIGIDEGLEAGMTARDMARRLGLPHVESAALDAIQSHALWGGRVQQAAEITSERLEIVGAISDPVEVGDTYAMAAWLAYDFGRFTLARDRALHGYKRTIDEAPNVALHNLSWATVSRVQLGEWDHVAAALSVASNLLDPERRQEPPTFATPLFAAAAMVAEFQGRSEEADRLLTILETVWSHSDLAERGGHPLARWAKHTGPIFLRREDYATVDQLVVSDDAEPIGRESARLAVQCDLIARRHQWDRADTAIEETRATASAYGLSLLVAHADRLEGRASLASRDRRGGQALLAAARERFDSLGDHWEAARTGLDIAANGGQIDTDYLTRFFADIGAIDELQQALRASS